MSNDSQNDPKNSTPEAGEETPEVASAAPPTPPTIGEAAASVATSCSFRACYLKLLARYSEIPADEAMRVTVDVGYVIQRTFGLLPEVEKLRDDIRRECPTVSPTIIEDLREGIGGLGHCEMLKRGATDAPMDLANNPVEAVRSIRDHLVSDGQPLIIRGKLTPNDLALSPGNSPRNVAFDVMRLAAKIDANYEFLDGRSLTTRADLEAASKAAEDLLEFLGVKEKEKDNVEEVTLTRQRALTYVYELFEELRWAVRYTRRKYNDADTIMPSLFTMRAKKSGGGKNDEPQPEVPSTAPESNEASTEVDLAHLQAIMSGNLPAGNTTTPPTPGTYSGGQGPTGNNNGGNR